MITSDSLGYKLELPWKAVRSVYFDAVQADSADGIAGPVGRAVVELDRPPYFYMGE